MKKTVFTSQAPEPIGPYSQAIVSGDLVFVSGQIPVDLETGRLELENVELATRLVLTHIKNILEKAGSGMENVVKASVFLKNMDDFPVVNQVYGEFFKGTEPPARETVEVSRLPKDVPVEISVIAFLKK